jgi:hypothetical protein
VNMRSSQVAGVFGQVRSERCAWFGSERVAGDDFPLEPQGRRRPRITAHRHWSRAQLRCRPCSPSRRADISLVGQPGPGRHPGPGELSRQQPTKSWSDALAVGDGGEPVVGLAGLGGGSDPDRVTLAFAGGQLPVAPPAGLSRGGDERLVPQLPEPRSRPCNCARRSHGLASRSAGPTRPARRGPLGQELGASGAG